MKILLLSDANSPHTIKWAKSLYNMGVEIAIWSFNVPKEGIYDDTPGILIRSGGTPQSHTSIWAKFKYVTALSSLKRFIKEFSPDIVHAHYATSYGLLGRLSKFKPFVISVWGADVYDFPSKGSFFKWMVQRNLNSADRVLSTSEDMKRITEKLTNKDIIVTPFGIDLNMFYRRSKARKSDRIVFGTIKTLEEKYGIRYMIKAYSIFRASFPDASSELLVVGGGSLEMELKTLANSLGIMEECRFLGSVPYSEVPLYHNELDIAIFPSILDSESFGVAAVEASASETPVIVSNVGGLPEVVEHGVTGIVVPPKDPYKLADAMAELYMSADKRSEMGKAGRNRVEKLYDLKMNVRQMIEIYNEVVK